MLNEDVLEQIVDDYLQFKGCFTPTTSNSSRARTTPRRRGTRTGSRPMLMWWAFILADGC